MQDLESLFVKAINYDYPEEIPIQVGCLPAAFLEYGDHLRKIFAKYPEITNPMFAEYDYEKHAPKSFRVGEFTDAWGCVWSNKIEGMEAYVTGHPIKNREDILTFEVPEEDAGLPHGFMYLRLLDLRGFEEAMIDFAEECDEIQILIDKVCEYNVRQLNVYMGYFKKIVWLGDDNGMQTGLAIGADKWRKYLKPAYKKIYDVAHANGKYVYMHTDGQIYEILPDFQEAGADIINPQYRANGIDNLVRVCKGKIPISLDLDRQLFPFCSPKDLRDHVRETVEKMYLPEGGLGINLEVGQDVSLENIDALLSAVNEYRFYKGK